MYILPEIYPNEVLVDSPSWERSYLDGIYTGEKRQSVWYCTVEQWLTGIFEWVGLNCESNGKPLCQNGWQTGKE